MRRSRTFVNVETQNDSSSLILHHFKISFESWLDSDQEHSNMSKILVCMILVLCFLLCLPTITLVRFTRYLTSYRKRGRPIPLSNRRPEPILIERQSSNESIKKQTPSWKWQEFQIYTHTPLILLR